MLLWEPMRLQSLCQSLATLCSFSVSLSASKCSHCRRYLVWPFACSSSCLRAHLLRQDCWLHSLHMTQCFHCLPWRTWGTHCWGSGRSLHLWHIHSICYLVFSPGIYLWRHETSLPLVSFQYSHPHVMMKITSECKTPSLVFTFVFSMTNFV